jgi:hypothetical protein
MTPKNGLATALVAAVVAALVTAATIIVMAHGTGVVDAPPRVSMKAITDVVHNYSPIPKSGRDDHRARQASAAEQAAQQQRS